MSIVFPERDSLKLSLFFFLLDDCHIKILFHYFENSNVFFRIRIGKTDR
jgi:hypothetical protein